MERIITGETYDMAKKTDPASGEAFNEMSLTIRPPKMAVMSMLIKGDPSSPYVQHRFSAKARNKLKADQEAGGTKKKNRHREAKDFEQVYRDACHIAAASKQTGDEGGWYGIPAASLRSAMISACRVSGFAMTAAKLSVFIEADGRDEDDGSPLVRINGEPEPMESTVRNATGVVDIRRRPAWYDWSANLRIVFDADQFKPEDVISLVIRAGTQVGIGEGRHDSKKSNGQGWGCFTIEPGSVTVKIRSLADTISELFAKQDDTRSKDKV